jgi:RNA polymerase sigma factor (sigma-70 family)
MSAFVQSIPMLKVHRNAGTAATPLSNAAPPVEEARWRRLVERIQHGDDAGMRELYEIFHRGVRFYLCRQLGSQELEDKVHDTFLIVVEAIQAGELRQPERLMGFVRTVVRRQVAAHIDNVVQLRKERTDLEGGTKVVDHRQNPEQTVLEEQRAELMYEVLMELGERDREILTRFYLREESQEQICADMELSMTQFRLLKSRAKARFGEMGKKKLIQRSLRRFSLRKS